MRTPFIDGLVTIHVTTYNHAGFIEDCVKSILAQSYRNLEVLICDDASTDGNVDKLRAIETWDSRVKVLYSERNGGMSRNVNKGLREARGEYIAVISGDDLMDPLKIEKQVAFFRQHPAVVLCYHDMVAFDHESGDELYRVSERYRTPETVEENLFFTNWFLKKKPVRAIPSSLMARSAYFLRHEYDVRLSYSNEVLHALLNYAAEPSGKQVVLNEALDVTGSIPGMHTKVPTTGKRIWKRITWLIHWPPFSIRRSVHVAKII